MWARAVTATGGRGQRGTQCEEALSEGRKVVV